MSRSPSPSVESAGLDIEAILGRNERVEVSKLQEVLEVLEKMEDLGIPDATYDLIPPFTRQAHTATSEERLSTSRSVRTLRRA